MRVVLESIGDERTRFVPDDCAVEEREVRLRIDGRPRTFTVFHRPSIVPPMGIVYGDSLLVELLRFDPVALGTVCSAVAARTRGEDVSLPIQLPMRPSKTQRSDDYKSGKGGREPPNTGLQTDEDLPPSSVEPRS